MAGDTNRAVNLWVKVTARRYVTTFAGFDEPWGGLPRVVPDLEVAPVALGGAHIAWGTTFHGIGGGVGETRCCACGRLGRRHG